MFEAGAIKICMNQTNGDISSLESKVAMLEQKLNSLNFNASPKVANGQMSKQVVNKQPERTAVRTSSKPAKQTEDWKEIVESLKKSGKIRLYTCLVNTTVNKLNDQTWEIEFLNGLTEFNKKILEDITNKKDLIKTITMLTGNEINIRLKDGKMQPVDDTNGASGLEDLGIDINIIE